MQNLDRVEHNPSRVGHNPGRVLRNHGRVEGSLKPVLRNFDEFGRNLWSEVRKMPPETAPWREIDGSYRMGK